SEITLERPMLIKPQLSGMFLFRLFCRSHWRLHPGRTGSNQQSINTLFLPTQHTRRNVRQTRIKKPPLLTNLDRYVRRFKSSRNYFVPIEEAFPTIRQQSDMSFQSGSFREGGKQQIDVHPWPNATLESVGRFLILLKLFDIIFAEA